MAGLTTLRGNDFGAGPAAPMLPGSRHPGSPDGR
ncbi:hypothetical protein [Mycobacterium sp. 050134]